MERPSGFVVKAIVAIMLASLVAPPIWASADSTVVNDNTSEDAEAESGAADAATALDLSSGPRAEADVASATAVQDGDNESEGNQSAVSRSGDGVAGSQVTSSGVFLGSDEDVAAENTNDADDAEAESGTSSALAAASGHSGPVASSGPTSTATAVVGQDGDNETTFSQSTDSESGSASAGTQFEVANADLPGGAQAAPSAIVAWLAFALIGTYMLLMLTRRSPARETSGPRPNLLTDDAMGATLRIPSGWSSTRSDRVFAMFDPSTSADGSIEEAETGVLCILRRGSDELGPRAAAKIARHSSYRHVDSGYVHVAGHRAFQHTFDLALHDRSIRVQEHFVPRDADGEVLRITAYAAGERAESLPGAEEVLHRL